MEQKSVKAVRLGQLMLPVRMAAWTENFTCHKHVLSSLKASRTQHIETKFRQIKKKNGEREGGKKKKKLTRKTCKGIVAIVCANKAT